MGAGLLFRESFRSLSLSLLLKRLFRFFSRLGELVPLGLSDELAALRKPVLATLRNGAGRTRRKRWDLGSCAPGGGSCFVMPMGAIWLGGIHGARRWTRPRMCWGIRRAVARAYMAPALWAMMENLERCSAWHIARTSSAYC
jgi:hypothetical protein